jgi:hypothetical protein
LRFIVVRNQDSDLAARQQVRYAVTFARPAPHEHSAGSVIPSGRALHGEYTWRFRKRNVVGENVDLRK